MKNRVVFKVFKLKFLIVITLILTILLSFFILPNGAKSTFMPRQKTVVIDAGHGGLDGGVTSANGTKESDLNLKISFKLFDIFEKNGYKVIMTRKDENGLYGDTSKGFKMRDMKERKRIIQNASPDYMISIHSNKFPSPCVRGAQAFYKPNSVESKKLASLVQTELNSIKGGVKKKGAILGDYYVLNASPKCGILVECGFLSNSEDEKLLLTSEYQTAIAEAVFKGVANYAISFS